MRYKIKLLKLSATPGRLNLRQTEPVRAGSVFIIYLFIGYQVSRVKMLMPRLQPKAIEAESRGSLCRILGWLENH